MNAKNDEPEYFWPFAHEQVPAKLVQPTLRNWDRNITLKAFRLGNTQGYAIQKADFW